MSIDCRGSWLLGLMSCRMVLGSGMGVSRLPTAPEKATNRLYESGKSAAEVRVIMPPMDQPIRMGWSRSRA